MSDNAEFRDNERRRVHGEIAAYHHKRAVRYEAEIKDMQYKIHVITDINGFPGTDPYTEGLRKDIESRRKAIEKAGVQERQALEWSNAENPPEPVLTAPMIYGRGCKRHDKSYEMIMRNQRNRQLNTGRGVDHGDKEWY